MIHKRINPTSPVNGFITVWLEDSNFKALVLVPENAPLDDLAAVTAEALRVGGKTFANIVAAGVAGQLRDTALWDTYAATHAKPTTP